MRAGPVDGQYLRGLARRCRELSQNCFDLTVAGELRTLAEELESKSRRTDQREHGESMSERLNGTFARIKEFARDNWPSWLKR